MKKKFRIKVVYTEDFAVQMKILFWWHTIKVFDINDIPFDGSSAADYKEAFEYNKKRALYLLEQLEEDQ